MRGCVDMAGDEAVASGMCPPTCPPGTPCMPVSCDKCCTCASEPGAVGCVPGAVATWCPRRCCGTWEQLCCSGSGCCCYNMVLSNSGAPLELLLRLCSPSVLALHLVAPAAATEPPSATLPAPAVLASPIPGMMGCWHRSGLHRRLLMLLCAVQCEPSSVALAGSPGGLLEALAGAYWAEDVCRSYVGASWR